jgi:multiple sugar transport system substrate-binding protein
MITKKRAMGAGALGASLALILAGCAGGESSETGGSGDGSGGGASAELSAADQWFADAADALECRGVTLNGVTENTPPGQYVANTIIPAFEAATGITVNLETTSWDEMYSKAINDMEAATGIYDFVYIEQDIVYAYLAQDYLVNMSEFMRENPEAVAPTFDLSLFTTFIDDFKDANGDVYGIPMEAFVKVYLYRTDLFEDPEIQALFKEETGKDLAPATNWPDYVEISEFFYNYGQDNNLELWGSTVQAVNGHPASFYEFFESVAPTVGVYNWGITDDFKADVANGGRMNSPEAILGLETWLGLLKFAPPESTQSTWSEVAATFAAGRAAQGLVYGENAAWIASDESQSQVVGNVKATLPPLADGVLADAEAGRGYVGYYDGGAFGIPHSSKNIACSVLFQQYHGQESWQAEWAANGGRIVHNSTYDDPIVVEMDAQTQGYFTHMREQGYLYKGAPAFPFHAQVREVVAPFIYEAIAGNITPTEALNQAAAAAEAEMVKLGYGN